MTAADVDPAKRLVVTVPDEAMRLRLAESLASIADLVVWEPAVTLAPTGPIDLAVLPYMVGSDYLAHLVGQPVAVVQSQMLGYDRLAEFLPAGLTYCNAVGVHEASTGELALALTLASQRGIPAFRDSQRERSWSRHRTPGLAGSRVLIIGAGGVGQQVAARFAGFSVELRMVARTARDSEYGQVQSMEALGSELAAADIVVLAVPLSDETRGLADAGFLAEMRDGALLVNVSRGPVVDTAALVSEVTTGRLRAALDVVDPEPLPADHPLWTADGVLITPHVGGETGSMTALADRLIRAQIERLATGEPLAHVVVQG